ncbi:hypothetical protein [uncultured Tenacibaculum sp.]|uniref:hypothetical protein n=1 Tax=uncultured Tenacibaculum sp. TaxID=174713 RepID=UPI00260D3540|nr:hypothetical protein [uncultured Tenacibaculum sp.]
MKKLLFLLLVSTSVAFAQKNINNYKYVIVPKNFDGFKSADQYQTSSLLKFLFNKHGFKAFFDDETKPEDLQMNNCKALTAVVKKGSGFLSTKATIEMRDCQNRVVYVSKEGFSKIKEYKRAYHEAIRESFVSVKGLNYKYIPPKEETKVVKRDLNVTTVRKQTLNTETQPKASVAVKEVKKVNTTSNSSFATLYAQPRENGFQLIDDKPQVVFKILKTQYPNIYILENANGMLIQKENGFWEAQFYKEGKLTTKSYKIKF